MKCRTLQTCVPCVCFRYSHSTHVIGERLVVVGGVWLQAESVPGVAVINLCTGASVEYHLDTVSSHVLFTGIQFKLLVSWTQFLSVFI